MKCAAVGEFVRSTKHLMVIIRPSRPECGEETLVKRITLKGWCNKLGRGADDCDWG